MWLPNLAVGGERLNRRSYEACGEACRSRSIGSHTKAVCTTCCPPTLTVASATAFPPSRW